MWLQCTVMFWILLVDSGRKQRHQNLHDHPRSYPYRTLPQRDGRYYPFSLLLYLI